MDERAFALGFLAIEGVGSTRLRRLQHHFASLECAWHANPQELSLAGMGPDIAQAIAAQRPAIDLKAELERLESSGTQLIACWEPDYPPLLKEIHDPPAMLFWRGRWPNMERAVAIVGTRGCSGYGGRMARTLARDLARQGILIVSGLAAGIDAAAHQGALETGETLAVMATGLDRIYPASNTPLARQILPRGALVSEYPLGTEPTPGQFPARNRIISGLAQATIVVEAQEKSGSLITADQALEQNREVMAVPGPMDSPNSRGPHRLIQQGAKLITCAQDVLEELGWEADHPPSAPPDLTPDEARVLAAIEPQPTPLDRIAQKSGLAPQVVNSVLLTLELKALINQLPGRRYARR